MPEVRIVYNENEFELFTCDEVMEQSEHYIFRSGEMDIVAHPSACRRIEIDHSVNP